VTLNETTGELRTGPDGIDFEEITEIIYTVIASDGENSKEMDVSYIDQIVQFPKIM
jgi:hypothetical protein